MELLPVIVYPVVRLFITIARSVPAAVLPNVVPSPGRVEKSTSCEP